MTFFRLRGMTNNGVVQSSHPDQGVMERCKQHQSELVICAPIWHELQFGCYRMPLPKKRELLEVFLEEVVHRNLPILPYDELAARWQAAQRARLSWP